VKRILAPALAVLVLSTLASLPSAAAKTPTFSKDVAPILYKNCVSCHRPNEIGPMALRTYQEARPWAKSIREKVVTRAMPPWSADPQHGEFENDPRLSQQDVDTIVAWVDGGLPKGNDKDLPPLPKFTEGWTVGQPDVVLEMKEEFDVPASGVVPYMYFRIPTGFTEDKWIQALEIRPGARGQVHHVIAFSQTPPAPGAAPATDGRNPGGARNQLGGITPNARGVVFNPGTARLIKAGADIVFQMHYTPNGTAAKDRTKIGLIFAKEPPKKLLLTGMVPNFSFRIPPGDPNFEVVSTQVMRDDTYLTSFMPHMHVRGKDFIYTAIYPDGREEILLKVPKYDFNWQHTYKLKQPKLLPKGTTLRCVAHFDNSPGNKYNPDPTKEVRWGDQTWEEMMIGWYGHIKDAPAAQAAPSSSTGR
jgi:mono/diheme cytochrome c family protein